MILKITVKIMKKNGVMKMNNFFEFSEIGALKIDKVFFESFYPILFTCRNDEGDLFLCVCCDDNKLMRKWLITKVKPTTVIELLTNKTTMRDAFLKDNGAKYSIILNNASQEYSIEIDNYDDWNSETSIDLPTTGEYIDAEEDEFLEEIQYYKYNLQKENFLEEKFHKDYSRSITKIDIPSSVSFRAINEKFYNNKIFINYQKTFKIDKTNNCKSNFIYKYDIDYAYYEQLLKKYSNNFLSDKLEFTTKVEKNKKKENCSNENIKNLAIAA